VHVVSLHDMWQALQNGRVMPQCSLRKRINMQQQCMVSECQEPVGANDTIELGLCKRLDLGVDSHGNEEQVHVWNGLWCVVGMCRGGGLGHGMLMVSKPSMHRKLSMINRKQKTHHFAHIYPCAPPQSPINPTLLPEEWKMHHQQTISPRSLAVCK
jgi:hypothetical protein